MKKDVLFLCQYFFPEYISSANLPFETAKKLVEKGYSVDVLTGYPKEYLKNKINIKINETIFGMNVKRVKYITANRKKRLGRLINYFSFTTAILFKLLMLRKYKYIYVYSNPPLIPYIAYLGNLFFGIKIIYILYDIYPEIALISKTIKHKKLIHIIMNHINRMIFRKLSLLVVLSRDMEEFILKNREITKNKILVIENWYNRINDENISLVKNVSIFHEIEEDERMKFVYTGNLGIAQDSDLIIELIKENKNSDKICFIIAGHGNKIKDLKELLNETKMNNLYIYDFLHDEEFNKLLLIADVFLLSLKRELTGLASPSKLYSYLAAGKPLVAMIDENSYLAKTIIKENVGIVIDSDNLSKLTDSILSIKLKSINYINMCQNSINLFEKSFETNVATEKYVNMMNTLKEINDNER